jgi:hypothetical protein
LDLNILYIVRSLFGMTYNNTVKQCCRSPGAAWSGYQFDFCIRTSFFPLITGYNYFCSAKNRRKNYVIEYCRSSCQQNYVSCDSWLTQLNIWWKMICGHYTLKNSFRQKPSNFIFLVHFSIEVNWHFRNQHWNCWLFWTLKSYFRKGTVKNEI